MFLHKYEMAVQRVLRFCAAKLTAPVVLHAHSNLSAQQPPTLYSHADSCTEICPFIPSSFILYSSLVPSAYDRPQLALSSVPITPGLLFFVSHLHATYAYTRTRTRTHTHMHTHTHTHTHTQLPSKAMRLLGWCIVYYKVAGMERPDGSICMSVYEFHLLVSFFWSLLGNVNGVVNKLFIFPFNPVDTKANHIRNPFLIRVLNENVNKIQFYIYI